MSEKGKEYLIPKLDFQNNSSSNKAYIIRHTGYESIVYKVDGVLQKGIPDLSPLSLALGEGNDVYYIDTNTELKPIENNKSDIDTIKTNLNYYSTGGKLTAIATNGNIYLENINNGISNNLDISYAWAQNNVYIKADQSIIDARDGDSGNIFGRSIELVTVNGTIGENVSNPLKVDTNYNGATGGTLTDISGSDLYTFSQGDGIDVLTDLDSTLEDIDTIDFTEGIDKEDIAVFMDNNDLVIGYGPDDQIIVKNQAEEVYGVEMLQLADGDFITAEDINMIVQEMTAFADTEGFAITSVGQVQANPDLMNIVMNGWS